MGLIKRNWILILVILVAVGLFVAFRLNQKPEAEYFTAKIEQGDIRQVIEATGTINPVTLVQVGSQVSGMISKLYVDFNSRVAQGQVIAEIDPKLFQGAVLAYLITGDPEPGRRSLMRIFQRKRKAQKKARLRAG